MALTKANRIMLIINPVSGKTKSRTALFDILDSLYRLPDGAPDPERRVTVCPTMQRGHASALAATACREGYDQIVCCGGDGTLNEVINGLMTVPAEERIPLGYVAAGSTNDFASSMGLPTHLKDAAALAAGDKASILDIGEFIPAEQAEGARSRFFSYIASFGAFTETSYSTPQSAKNVLGHMAYILQGIGDATKIKPLSVRVELDDGTVTDGDYLFGAVTNTTSAGGVIRLPDKEVSMSDGTLEVFMIRNPANLAEFNRIIQSLLSSDYTGNPLIEFHHTSHVRFLPALPLRWSLDGEEADGGSCVDIYCRNHAIMLKK